jgi:hypothetical protein
MSNIKKNVRRINEGKSRKGKLKKNVTIQVD